MNMLEHMGLTQSERRVLQDVSRILKAELPVTHVILFGSKARGDARPDSDMDLLVLTSKPVTRELRSGVRRRAFDLGLRDDVLLTPIVMTEEEWSGGLVRHMLIHSEIERDGCEV